MELTLKPHAQNTAPLAGMLLIGGTVAGWLRDIQAMGFSLSALTVYALPQAGTTRLWGCLVAYDPAYPPSDVGRHQYCQLIGGLLFIPEKAALFPQLSATDLDKLLLSRPHFFHPETGLIDLVRAIDWSERLAAPAQRPLTVRKPAPTVFIPTQVRSFQVQVTPPEEVLERLEENQFPKRQPLETKPLSPLEQAKLVLYRQLLGQPGATSPLLPALTTLRALFTGKKDDWIGKLEADREDLETRNQQQLDRLLDLLKRNPGEALKYAIPLDEDGTSRGSDKARFELSLRWPDFSLFTKSDTRRSGGASVLPDDGFHKLRSQYEQTARELLQQREFHKAAFVYLKLLKNYALAGQTLESGNLFAEAASVWLKYGQNKAKAAHCYEQANMTEAAIDLYRELGHHEKAGDLYTVLNRPAEARLQYQLVIDGLTTNSQFVKAALVYRHKLHDAAGGQSMLLTGWREGKDAYNCLNNYFAAITDPKELDQALQHVYANQVNATNREAFLQVIRHEYTRHPELTDAIADMAYELIADQLPSNPAIASELRFFGKPDHQLTKDIVRFRNNNRSNRK